MLALLNIGPLEWIVLLGGAVLLFGGDLPGVVRKLAQMLGRLRAMASDLSREVDLHGRYESPPEPPRIPPPPIDFADAELEAHPGDDDTTASDPPADVSEPDRSTEREDAPTSEAPATEDGEPPDHSDWEPESGADRPRRLDDQDP